MAIQLRATIKECETLIPTIGETLTPIIQSEAGCGKTSLLKGIEKTRFFCTDAIIPKLEQIQTNGMRAKLAPEKQRSVLLVISEPKICTLTSSSTGKNNKPDVD